MRDALFQQPRYRLSSQTGEEQIFDKVANNTKLCENTIGCYIEPMNSNPNASAKISFKKPPIAEVCFGVQMSPLIGFLTPHIGQLWEKYKGQYPICREQLATTTGFEFDPNMVAPTPESVISPSAPIMHRSIFATADDSSVIQVQRDAFYFNWQRHDTSDDYPRYEPIVEQFETHFATFSRFIRENKLGDLVPLQLELTYLNEIPMDGIPSEIHILKDAHWKPADHNFLSGPDNISIGASFLLGDAIGHLYSTFNSVLKPNGEPVFQWVLVAKGTTQSKNVMKLDQMRPWFDNARDWIVKGFVDLSTREAQNVLWERIS